MGHHTETTELAVWGNMTPKQALREAIEIVYEENGTNYNVDAGAIQLQSPKTMNESYDDSSLIYGRSLYTAPPSIVTPLVDDNDVSRRTVSKTLIFSGNQWEKAKKSESLYRLISDAAAKEVTLRKGERVETVLPDEDNQRRTSRFIAALTNGSHITRTSKIVTRNTEGKPVTRYAILANGNRHNSHRDLWNDGHASQAAARKHMIELLDRHADSDYMDEAEIVAVTRRDNGSPLVVSKREVSKVRVNVLVTLVNIPANAKISHYRVSFDVHS